MQHAAEELLSIQSGIEQINTNKQNSSNQIYETERVEGTAFDIIKVPEQGAFIALGRHRLTEYTTIDECKRMIEGIPKTSYELLLGLMGATMLSHNQELQDRIEQLEIKMRAHEIGDTQNK